MEAVFPVIASNRVLTSKLDRIAQKVRKGERRKGFICRYAVLHCVLLEALVRADSILSELMLETKRRTSVSKISQVVTKCVISGIIDHSL